MSIESSAGKRALFQGKVLRGKGVIVIAHCKQEKQIVPIFFDLLRRTHTRSKLATMARANREPK
jgi:hypothetical protein